MKRTQSAKWENKKTEETCQVEQLLRKAGFQEVDAYRYNSAAIRVRVIDPRFKGKTHEQRVEMLEPFLETLPHKTRQDIISLFLFTPNEVEQSTKKSGNLTVLLLNHEFENPSPSML